MKKQKTEELWRICFNDSEEFIRLFFDEVYRDENTLVIEKDGQLAAALQILPYTMMLCGKEIPVAYIFGVCTHPDERRKGMMGRLMQEVEAELKLRSIPLATLIPAEPRLFDIYRKYDYSEAFYYGMGTYRPVTIPEKGNSRLYPAETTTPGLYPFFDQKLRERTACILHSEADFMIDLSLYFFQLCSCV